MHRYDIITTLPFSKNASPIFAQRKPNGKLRLLVVLKKINALTSDECINNNHPVSTTSDAAEHLGGRKGKDNHASGNGPKTAKYRKFEPMFDFPQLKNKYIGTSSLSTTNVILSRNCPAVLGFNYFS